jgi:hypothetical protein
MNRAPKAGELSELSELSGLMDGVSVEVVS